MTVAFKILLILIVLIVLSITIKNRVLNVINFRNDIKIKLKSIHKNFDEENFKFILPNINLMIFSFKALKIENWFSVDQMHRLFVK